MNITIAAAGLGSWFSIARDSAAGILFISVFAAVGVALLVVGSRLLRRCHELHDPRYAVPEAEAEA